MPSPKAIADAKAVLRADRKARAKQRPQRIQHKPIEGKAFRGRDKDAAHLTFIRQLPCLVTLARHGVEAYGVEACHVRTNYPDVVGWGGNPGLSVKPADWRTLPMLPACHREQHARGDEQAFWREVGIYPPKVCAQLRLITGNLDRGLEIIRGAAASARETLSRRGAALPSCTATTPDEGLKTNPNTAARKP